MAFNLHITTVHCIGRLNYKIGTVETEDQAIAWVEGATGAGLERSTLPADDPIVWCPVKHCHMKRQKPVRSYRQRSE